MVGGGLGEEGRGRRRGSTLPGSCGSGAPVRKGALRWRSLESVAAERW